MIAPHVLRLDHTGRPVTWLSPEEASVYYAKDAIVWTLGEPLVILRGGWSRARDMRSTLDIHPIIAVRGEDQGTAQQTPRLDNRTLFQRDQHLCLYCGETHAAHDLTRDHVHPLAQGGRDRWENVVTACRRCNHHKGARTPEEADMPLLAVPFKPNRAEWLALSGRRILADQMAFLSGYFSARMRERM